MQTILLVFFLVICVVEVVVSQCSNPACSQACNTDCLSFQCSGGRSFGSDNIQDCCTRCDNFGDTVADVCTCCGDYCSFYPSCSTYLGCYNDENTRDFSNFDGSTTYTLESCTTRCKALGNQYMGLQYGGQCGCGDTYGTYGIATFDADCDTPCNNDPQEICGGGWLNSVYDVSSCPTAYYSSCASYIGCYVDNNPRDFTYFDGSTTYTVESCIDYCKTFGSKYMGLQYGGQCGCGDSYGTYGSAADSDCDFVCINNDFEICGGSLRNSIYDISSC